MLWEWREAEWVGDKTRSAVSAEPLSLSGRCVIGGRCVLLLTRVVQYSSGSDLEKKGPTHFSSLSPDDFQL